MNINNCPTVYDEKIPESVKVPTEAYLYFPSGMDLKIGEGKKGIRRIFEGQVIFDTFELEMIQILKHMIQKQTENIIDLSSWEESELLRFLQANHFKFDNTIKSIKQNDMWRSKFLPAKFTQNVNDFLNSGIVYVHGRDSKFRPTIILNAYKINMQEMSIEYLLEGLSYLLEYTILYIMLPGQVENWNIIVDLNFMGLFNLPLTNFKRVLEFVQSNYRSRLFHMYILNSPTSIFIPWKIAKQFLDENTIQKIKIYKTGYAPELFFHTNKEQIEKKFGGTSENIQKYWPPCFPSNKYYLNEKDFKSSLISKEEYYLMYKEGMLNKNKVNQDVFLGFLIKKEERKTNNIVNISNDIIITPKKRNEEVVYKINLIKEEENSQNNLAEHNIYEQIINDQLYEYDAEDDDEFINKFHRIHESLTHPSKKKGRKKLSDSFPG